MRRREAGRSSRATPGERAAVAELVKAARAYDKDITGPERAVEVDHRHGAGVGVGGGDDGPSRSRQAPRPGGCRQDECVTVGPDQLVILTGNIRNGTRPKTVLTDAAGEVTIEVSRDRGGHVRAGDSQKAAEAPHRRGGGGDLVIRQRVGFPCSAPTRSSRSTRGTGGR